MYAHLRPLVISALSLILVAAALHAAPPGGVPGPDETWSMPNRDVMNANTVTIITAPAGGASAIFGSDIMRVLVAGDVPEFYKLQYKVPDITSRLRYIAKLYNNEIHVLAPASVKSIFDLEGKRITAQTDVGYYSAKVIFARLGMKAQFDYWTDDARAIQKLIDGESDAYITSTGKVFPLARAIKNEDRRLHLVPIPYDPRLLDLYLPTTLSGEEYPNLLAPGEKIETVATSVLLATFNWPEDGERYRRTAKFVDAFFSKFDEFHKPPRHPKWAEASIGIKIPGWERFKAADDWIAQHATTGQSQRDSFDRFLATNNFPDVGTPEKRAAVFRQFLEWQRTQRPGR